MHPAVPGSKADVEAAALADGYHNRWFLDPMLKGNYPQDMIAFFRERGACPTISSADMDAIGANRCDFLGINYYFRKVIRADASAPIIGYTEVKPKSSAYTDMGWEIYPKGLYELLMRVKGDYGDPRMVVTENGAAFADDRREGELIADDDRIDFMRSHIAEASRAIADGARLEGYYAWSLLDNFEWAFGYGKRFGLIGVDYATQARVLKKSALWYRDAIAE
jgi:beta-glucosidase